MFLMHTYSLVSLMSTCNATVNAECVKNGVVRFLVCCGTFVLSVGLFFFQRGVGFSQAMSLSAPCEKFEFLAFVPKVKILNTRAPVYVWVSVRVCGRMGVLVSGCLFSVDTC